MFNLFIPPFLPGTNRSWNESCIANSQVVGFFVSHCTKMLSTSLWQSAVLVEESYRAYRIRDYKLVLFYTCPARQDPCTESWSNSCYLENATPCRQQHLSIFYEQMDPQLKRCLQIAAIEIPWPIATLVGSYWAMTGHKWQNQQGTLFPIWKCTSHFFTNKVYIYSVGVPFFRYHFSLKCWNVMVGWQLVLGETFLWTFKVGNMFQQK